MKTNRKSTRWTFAISVAASLAAGAVEADRAQAQDFDPIRVVTFDREFVNWATTVERRSDFPEANVPIQRIVMTIALDCPGGGCDPWDRGASVFVRGRDPSGQADSFELARFITPYGMGCSWEVDVTDYRIFLAGNAGLGFFVETYIGGDRGWLVTLSFDFYPGTPERVVSAIENLWRGRPVYGDPDNPIDLFFAPKTVSIDPHATAAKLRFIVTGHGQGNTDNAAEFARKLHTVRVGSESFEHYLWRDDCDRNPCSPQGGTWQYARAGWCPGSDAPPWDVDVPDAVAAGATATILFEVEPYTNRCRPSASCTGADCIWGNCDYDSGSHTPPVYWVESQWISYRENLGGASYHVFQEGLDGYSGTVDTMLLEASPTADHAAALELGIDGDAGGGRATQVLIRFDDLFGEGPGQLPSGALIRSARLEFHTTDAGDGAAAYRLRGAWSEADTWATFGADGIQAGVETLPEPDGIADATGGALVSIDVTRAVSSWAESACPYFGWALLPIGTNGWDFDSSEGSEPPRLIIVTRALAQDPLIAVGEEWKYWKGTAAPPATWNRPDFVPGAGWLSGPTGLGFGDDDDATILADMQGNYSSVFLRREFRADAALTALRLEIDYDDGFAAYLNGTEVVRSASLAAVGAPLSWNSLARSGREAGTTEVYDLPLSTLVPGTNVLAVQVHNNTLDSSDLSVIPALVADYAIIAPGTDWRFLRGSAPLPQGWTERDFDDSGWEEGPTGIGYGDGDDATRLPDMQDSYGAIFCRREFDLSGPSALVLSVVYDDGIVVFVNGTELERINMPAGPVSAALFASSAVEPTLATVSIPAALLLPGRNVIAVSVHNSAIDSSDLSFDPILIAAGRVGSEGCTSSFRRGDSNGDGRVDLSDAVFLLGTLFLGHEAAMCDDASDANDDGLVNISDAIMTLSALFLGQGPIPPPGMSDCGEDPTEDVLGCEAVSPCL